MAKKEKGKEKVQLSVSSGALAVKYRPHKLKDMVGQDHAVAMVKGMLKKGEIPSTFLIEGGTGSGKTTMARIMNTYLNCDTGKACGKCDSCKSSAKFHPDLTTVNAGTDGKVDDIRKLIKGSRAAPYYNKRVILIDEAHKLTGASAEALLVPLEEPSRSTIWILCTTNPEKMISTIRTRCMVLTMKPMDQATIVGRLAYIAEQEGTSLDSKEGKQVLNLIADFSNGSMRAAISLLENVLYAAAGGADVTNKDVLSAYIQNSEIDLDKAAVSMVAAICNNDLKAAIRFVRKSGNARGMLSKSRWLVDYLIGDKTKTAKFKPYSGRLFDKVMSDKGIESPGLGTLLQLQLALVDAEMKMNSTSIDESVLLQTAIAKYAFENAEEEGEE